MHKAWFGALVVAALLAGCQTVPPLRSVRRSDLDAWKGVPVAALDAHPIFRGMHTGEVVRSGGVEVRHYLDMPHGVGCDHTFTIQDGKVLEYMPVGPCYTDETLRPWLRSPKRNR